VTTERCASCGTNSAGHTYCIGCVCDGRARVSLRDIQAAVRALEDAAEPLPCAIWVHPDHMLSIEAEARKVCAYPAIGTHVGMLALCGIPIRVSDIIPCGRPFFEQPTNLLFRFRALKPTGAT